MTTTSLVAAWLLSLALEPAQAPPPEVAADSPSSATSGSLGTDAAVQPEPSNSIVEALRPQPGGLTADMVAFRAVEISPDVESSNAQIQLAAARVDQTIVSFLPRISASASYTRLSDINLRFGSGALVGAANPGALQTAPCPQNPLASCIVDSQGLPVAAASFVIPQVLNQFSTQASLSIPISDYVFRIVAGLAAARKSEESARVSTEASRRKVAIDARVAYYNWLRAVSQVAVAHDAIRTTEARFRDADLGYRVGTVTKSDKLRMEALVAQAKRVLTDGLAFEMLTREQIAIMIGDPVGDYQIGEDILEGSEPTTDLPELPAFIERAFAQRQELVALGLNTEALRSGIKTEKAGYAPRLEAFGDVIYANPNPRFFPPTNEWNTTWQVGARLSWSINQPLASRMRIKELQAQERDLAAQYESLLRGIRMEVTTAYTERQKAIAEMQLARVNREANEAAYEVVSAQFKAGRATATDVIVVQQDLITAQLQDINARIDLKVAEDKLKYATGSGSGGSADSGGSDSAGSADSAGSGS